jgi:hypothetical protein
VNGSLSGIKTVVRMSACGCVILAGILMAHAEPPLKLLREIPLPHGCRELFIQEASANLFVTGSNGVTIINLASDQVVRTFTNVVAIHGLMPLPDSKMAVYLADDLPELSVVWTDTFRRISKMKTGKNPLSVLATGPTTGFLLNGGDRNVTLFEPDDGDLMGTVELPGEPVFAAYNPLARLIFFGVRDQSQLLLMQTSRLKQIETWDLPPDHVPVAAVCSPERQVLFVLCRNKRLLVLNSSEGNILGQARTTSDGDKLAVDLNKRTVYVGGGKTLSVLRFDDSIRLIENAVELPFECQSVAVNPRTRKLYIGTANGVRVYQE